MCQKKLSIFRGDSCPLRFRVSRDGAELTLAPGDAGCFALFDPNGRAVLAKTVTHSDCTEDGHIGVTIQPEDTERLSPGRYTAELELIICDAVFTVFQGELEIMQDCITPEVR